MTNEKCDANFTPSLNVCKSTYDACTIFDKTNTRLRLENKALLDLPECDERYSRPMKYVSAEEWPQK